MYKESGFECFRSHSSATELNYIGVNQKYVLLVKSYEMQRALSGDKSAYVSVYYAMLLTIFEFKIKAIFSISPSSLHTRCSASSQAF